MNQFKSMVNVARLITAIYLLYNLKTLLGIDLFPNHHAPSIMRLPVNVIAQQNKIK